MNVHTIRTQQTVVTLANATELSARVIKDFSTNDIASSLNNNPLTYDALRGLILSRIQHNISKMQPAQ